MKGYFAFLLATACVALTAAAETAFEGQEIGSIELTVSEKSTMVAVAFRELSADTNQNVSVSNILSTVNLQNDDKVYVYRNGTYRGWKLQDGFWASMEKEFVLTPTGLVENAGIPADVVTPAIGEGFWLVRGTAAQTKIYLYGAAILPSATTAAAGAKTLMGNPKMEDATPAISGAVAGDQIGLVAGDGKLLKAYGCGKDGYWYRQVAGTDGPKLEKVTVAIPKGTGFWYNSTGSGSVSFTW